MAEITFIYGPSRNQEWLSTIASGFMFQKSLVIGQRMEIKPCSKYLFYFQLLQFGLIVVVPSRLT